MKTSEAPIHNKVGAFLLPFSLVVGVGGAVAANEMSPSVQIGDCHGEVHALGLCTSMVRSVTGWHLVMMWVAIVLAIVGTIYGIYLFFKGRDWL